MKFTLFFLVAIFAVAFASAEEAKPAPANEDDVHAEIRDFVRSGVRSLFETLQTRSAGFDINDAITLFTGKYLTKDGQELVRGLTSMLVPQKTN